MMLRKIVLAGVPEQVNIPIQICIERGLFAKHGVDVTFKLVPEGTGKMLQMIEQGEADVALTVTDAFIVARGQKRPVQLAGTWVDSPLVWAIAGKFLQTRADIPPFTDFKALVENIKGNTGDQKLKFGISRLGSGSHTMAYYASMLHGLTTGHDAESKILDFTVAHNFAGLRDGVQSNRFDCFLWEVFTTKPWFDRKELAYLGEVPTPWPAFSFVTGIVRDGNFNNSEQRAGLSTETAAAIYEGMFPALKEGADIFIAEGISAADTGDEVSPSIARIVLEHGHTEEDAKLWLSRCQYNSATSMAVDATVFENSMEILKKVGLVSETCDVSMLWNNDTASDTNPIITLK